MLCNAVWLDVISQPRYGFLGVNSTSQDHSCVSLLTSSLCPLIPDPQQGVALLSPLHLLSSPEQKVCDLSSLTLSFFSPPGVLFLNRPERNKCPLVTPERVSRRIKLILLSERECHNFISVKQLREFSRRRLSWKTVTLPMLCETLFSIESPPKF